MVVELVAPALAGAEGAWLLNVVEQAQRSRRGMVTQVLTTQADLILFITISKAGVVQVTSMPQAVLASAETSYHRFRRGHTFDAVSLEQRAGTLVE
jgi:hypothetical protein